MKYQFGNVIVLGLGGSVIVQNEINTKLLREWRALVAKYARTHKFVVVMGGGKLAREYQEAAASIRPISSDERDWLGIYATRVNAKLVQAVFGKLADPVLLDAPNKLTSLTKPVTVACGWEPGWSTDYVAMALAYQFGAHEVIMAGKPAFVYDKNPDQYVHAKPFTELTWPAYGKLVPQKWKPGANAPIDPVAAKFGKVHNVAAIVIDGKNLKNAEKLIIGADCDGTFVH